jgi:hypothetical protein
MGVKPGDLLPSTIIATLNLKGIGTSEVPAELIPKVTAQKEVLIPSGAIPAGFPKLTKAAKASVDSMSPKQLQHVAQLIIAVSRELWK